MKKKKISFDFDETLDNTIVYNYAIELIMRGIEVWVCTARTTDENSKPHWNDDLYEVTRMLGIPKDRIIFTEYVDKYEIIKDTDFIWHLDDNFEEADNISKYTNTVGIRFRINNDWKEQCDKLLC